MPKRKKEVEGEAVEAHTSPKKPKGKAKASNAEPAEPYVDETGWHIHPPSLIYKDWGAKPGKKIAAFDFDGTLANTKSGQQFPRDANDWRFYNKKVMSVVQQYHEEGYTIIVFSNQGGIKSKLDGKMAEKVKARIQQVVEKLNVPARVFLATLDDEFRKPDAGMWRFFLEHCNGGIKPDMKKSFFVGDAAGRPADFSDSDKVFAQAAGLPFKLPEEVFGEMEGKRALAPRAGTETTADMNPAITEIFTKLAEHYTTQGEGFKARAFTNVVSAISAFPQKIEQSNLKEVGKLKGVGKASINIIKEYLDTGKCTFLEELTGDKQDESSQKEAKKSADAARSMALNFM